MDYQKKVTITALVLVLAVIAAGFILTLREQNSNLYKGDSEEGVNMEEIYNESTIKVMSFNVGRCQTYPDYVDESCEAMAEVINACEPDVVCLNEIYGGNIFENQVKKLAELTGLKYYYMADAIEYDNKPFGNAIISRIPIVSAENIPVPDPEVKTGTEYYETRCVLKAKLINGVTVMATHIGLNDDEKINAVNTVLANLENEKCILMGDFNMTPDNQMLKPIYEKMTDSAVCFEEELMSFPSDAPDRKLDYIFVSNDLSVNSADIPEFIVSDHRPYVAEIEIVK